MTPLRETIERIIREEAAEARIRPVAVMGRSLRKIAIVARRRAIRRVLRETGCTQKDLAKAWGLEEGTVALALRREAPPPAPYDTATAERLRWAHGEARASQILAGRDQRALSDIHAWRRLCAKARAAA
jgi:hypothetical protein